MNIEGTTTARDFTSTITVDQTPEQVFKAVNDVRGWWSEEIDGPTDHLGAVFEFHYKDLHRSTQKITEWVPGRRVVWRVVSAAINFVKDVGEWNGTEIVFDIRKVGDKTELTFTHVGLAPKVECYGRCSRAWTFYIQESLPALIATGKGDPNRDGAPAANTESAARSTPEGDE
jgi:hypothetical protein